MKKLSVLLTAAVVLLAAFTSIPKDHFNDDFEKAVKLTNASVCYANSRGIKPEQYSNTTDKILIEKLKLAEDARKVVTSYSNFAARGAVVFKTLKFGPGSCVGCQGAAYDRYFRCVDNHGDINVCYATLLADLQVCCFTGACTCNP